jgi:hypothetical protein
MKRISTINILLTLASLTIVFGAPAKAQSLNTKDKRLLGSTTTGNAAFYTTNHDQFATNEVQLDYDLVYFWIFDTSLPNDTPLEEITSTFSLFDAGLIEYHSALDGYPFDPDHPNWRKASMERRNSPTPLNYRPEGNGGVPYADSEMRGLQIRQPFTGDGGENTMIFHVATTGFEDVVFQFAAKDEGAADNLVVDYSVAEGAPVWINSGLANPTPALTPGYQLFDFDFNEIEAADDNPHFKIRVRFDGSNMSADDGNRVTFNNISLDGVSIYGGNLPPYVANAVSLQEAIESGTSITIDLNDVFTDPDDDLLTFTAESSHTGMVEVLLNESLLTIHPQQRGEATILLTATDQVYPAILSSFRTLVYPEAYPLAQGMFTFDFWGPNEPEYAYPQNMLFLQSDTDDHGLNDPLLFAYFIPHDDYHPDDEPTIGFPYNNTRRTRLNGLGEDGIAFVNTGRDRDLGGALLAVDTRGISDAVIDWLAGTIVQNERVYALRLQYRTNINDPFADLLEMGNVVEYLAGSDGEVQLFEDIFLPADALEQEYLQLLWRYYLVEGEAGPRAQLRLDDIVFKEVTGIEKPDENNFNAWYDGNAIQLRFEILFNGTIEVYDALGRMIANETHENSNRASIPINSAKGIYLLRMSDGKNSIMMGKALVY